mgnify:CR=1 FL=1
MARRSSKNLEDLDQYILDDRLKLDPRARARKNQTIFTVLGLLMLIVGMGTVVFGVVEARKFTNNGNWPTVRGTITSTSIHTVTQRRSPTRYCVYANYSYNVGGRTYTHGWSTSDCSTSRAQTEAVAPSYIGSTGAIWYDPTNPDRAANQPIGSEFLLLIWGAGGLTLLAAMSFLVLAMKPVPEKRKLKQPATPL